MLWTVSTTVGGAGAEVRGRGGGGFGGREPGMQLWERKAKRGRRREDKEDTKTCEARTTERETRQQSQALSPDQLLF